MHGLGEVTSTPGGGEGDEKRAEGEEKRGEEREQRREREMSGVR